MGALVVVVAVFVFIALVHWMDSRRKEREAAQYHETYRRMLEQPGPSVERVLELMRRDQDRQRREKVDGQLLGGMIVCVAGLGLGAFLCFLVPDRPVYLVGLIPFFVGIVLLIHARGLASRATRTE